MATAALRAACKRLGGRALLRPALTAAAQQQPSPSRLLRPKDLKRCYCTNLPAVITQNPKNFPKVHLEVSGRLLPVIGFTDMHVYKVSFCSDNPEFAGNVVRKFMAALQSDRLEDLEAFLSHEVSIVAIKKIVGKGVMEVKLQSLEHTVEVKFEIEALKELVMAEGVSTRKEVQSVYKEVTDNDLAKVVIRGCIVNCICMVLVAMCSKGTYVWGSEQAFEVFNAMTP